MARDPYEYFRIEAREIRDGLGRGVLQLDKGATPEIVAGLLRLAHTLKGAARVVRQPLIADHAHAIEEALAPVRESEGRVERALVDRLLSLTDAISSEIAKLDAPTAARPVAPQSSAPVDDDLRAARPESADLDGLLAGVAEATTQLRGLRRHATAVEQARRLSNLLIDQIAPGPAAESPAALGASGAKARSTAEQLRAVIGGVERDLSDAIEQTDRELREVREAAERLRLLPVGTLFMSLERVVRDTAPSLGKEATFSARGGDVRLEAAVLSFVQSALIQMVRNAVAHGIEAPTERARVGKPRAGHVELDVTRRGNRVAFTCRDDGRGIDVDAVRRVAAQRGLLPSDGEPRAAGEILRLLLKGGLTTAGAITQAAGRGIGLDIVRDAAKRLGGDVTVETNANRGTTLTLDVPLSLSALDALLVDVGGVSAAIPLAAVRRTIRLAEGDVTRTPDGDAIVYEGKVIPFVPLRRTLGQQVTFAAERSVVVIEGNTALAAVGVARLLGVSNVIVRPLPTMAAAAPLVIGASLDADGAPQLVLDPAALVSDAVGRVRTEPAPTPQAAVVLVIDDSLTTRMMERSILESAGYEVDLATSAEEGLDKARARRYQLFLVDVEMPGMDGFSFVEQTRADPSLREVPAILVTSRNAPEDRRRGIEAGASDYVVKGDFDQNALLATIRRLVRR
ncbi:MAG TPA: response regulator [Polyangia bacterium]|nr:response regulator [Polyangia bacterium]